MKMVFDVESNGLHGEGFAVGWCVVIEDKVIDHGYAFALPSSPVDPWVGENVIPHLGQPTHNTPREVRNIFWAAWMQAKAQGATLWADCGWPVEANFLSSCISDDPEARAWEGPYPLYEIATVFQTRGWDPNAHYPRLEGETHHHPLGDARQSARLLQKALSGCAIAVN